MTSYPLKTKKKNLKNYVKRSDKIIKKNMTKKEFEKFKKIRNLKKQSIDNKHITKKYSHNSIITTVGDFNDKSTIDKTDPDLYVFGGLPGSGKTSTLGKFVPEKTVVIDTDEFRAELAKHHKSPLKNYNMAHSGYLQKESKELTQKALYRALDESRDVTFDTTYGNKKRVGEVIRYAKKKGYDVHLLATEMKPHNSIISTTNRFVRQGGAGRYVPSGMIAEEGNLTNTIIWNERTKHAKVDKKDGRYKYHSVLIRDTDAIVDKRKKIRTVYKRGKIKKDYNQPEN